MRKNKKAFTLVELLVAMAIIGVLLGLAIFGMATAQRAQRDTERKSALQDINLGIQSFYETYNIYPNTVLVSTGSNSAVTLCTGNGTTCTAAPNSQSKTVNLKGAAISTVTTTNTAIPGVTPVPASTSYCFDWDVAVSGSNPGGYAVCVKLENSQILCTGSGAVKNNSVNDCGATSFNMP